MQTPPALRRDDVLARSESWRCQGGKCVCFSPAPSLMVWSLFSSLLGNGAPRGRGAGPSRAGGAAPAAGGRPGEGACPHTQPVMGAAFASESLDGSLLAPDPSAGTATGAPNKRSCGCKHTGAHAEAEVAARVLAGAAHVARRRFLSIDAGRMDSTIPPSSGAPMPSAL